MAKFTRKDEARENNHVAAFHDRREWYNSNSKAQNKCKGDPDCIDKEYKDFKKKERDKELNSMTVKDLLKYARQMHRKKLKESYMDSIIIIKNPNLLGVNYSSADIVLENMIIKEAPEILIEAWKDKINLIGMALKKLLNKIKYVLNGFYRNRVKRGRISNIANNPKEALRYKDQYGASHLKALDKQCDTFIKRIDNFLGGALEDIRKNPINGPQSAAIIERELKARRDQAVKAKGAINKALADKSITVKPKEVKQPMTRNLIPQTA